MDVRLDGHHVRVLREESLRTRAELASEAGISKSTVERIETSEKVVRLTTARKLASALQVEPKVFATPLTRGGVLLGKPLGPNVVRLRVPPESDELLREGTNF